MLDVSIKYFFHQLKYLMTNKKINKLDISNQLKFEGVSIKKN